MLSDVPPVFQRQPESSWCTKRCHLLRIYFLGSAFKVSFQTNERLMD